jgi:hypothetical protein
MASTTTDVIYKSTGNVTSTTTDFIRTYRVRVYKHTSNVNGVQYPNSNETVEQFTRAQTSDTILDVSGLRCEFDVKRCAMYYPNTATVKIYNLAAGTETDIMEEGYRVIVEAGYEKSSSDSNWGQIFDGDILMCSREKQNGTDYILTILAVDGGELYDEGYANFTIDRGTTARNVVDNITNKASVAVDTGYISPSLKNKTYSKSIAVHGQVRNTLNDICKSLNCTWYIDNGQLNIIQYASDKSYLPNGMSAIHLSPKTGLLGNPKQVNQGVECKCLLNPQIVPYSLIEIDQQLITRQLVTLGTYSDGISTAYALDPYGLYRVVSVNHHGDTRSGAANSWCTEISAVTQNGNIPEMLGGSSDSAT